MAKQKADKAREQDYDVMVRPVVTEKTSLVGEDGSCVTFRVAKKATKAEVKEAVQRIYGVEVVKVRTMNCVGKLKRRGKQVGMTPSFKKAYITLAPGNTIDVVEGL